MLQSQLLAKMELHFNLLTQQDTASSPLCGNCTLDVWCTIIITLEFTGNDVYLPGLVWLLNRQFIGLRDGYIQSDYLIYTHLWPVPPEWNEKITVH